MMIDSIFIEYLMDLFDPFLNPQKRVFVGYLGTALLIALAVQVIVAKSGFIRGFMDLFSKKIWLSPSALVDYKILLINQALMMGIAPRLITKLTMATMLFEGMHIWFDGRVTLFPDTPAWVLGFLFTLTVFILDDGTKYLVHLVLHRWPILWVFHWVHHNAETLTPLTVYRAHPVEAVIFSLRTIIVQGVAIGGFLYFFGDRIELMTILGANAFLFAFNAAGSNLRHSHVWISYGRFLEHFLISPAQHQIHHSVESVHYNRNFGAVLAIWDYFGGTLYLAQKGQKIRFGIGEPEAAAHTLKTIYLAPFEKAFRMILPVFKG